MKNKKSNCNLNNMCNKFRNIKYTYLCYIFLLVFFLHLNNTLLYDTSCFISNNNVVINFCIHILCKLGANENLFILTSQDRI